MKGILFSLSCIVLCIVGNAVQSYEVLSNYGHVFRLTSSYLWLFRNHTSIEYDFILDLIHSILPLFDDLAKIQRKMRANLIWFSFSLI